MAFFQRTDDSGALYLAPGDNIAVATRELAAGNTVDIDDATIELKSTVDVGHKFAIHPISEGSRIVKYGAPIGIATADIAPGEYVHIHNLRSDYLPSYTLEPIEDQE
jgi:altronate dehydratase small subunit